MSREDALLVDDAFGQLQEPRRHAERLLGLLDAQRGQAPNVVVDLHEHGVQMATRMLRIGASEELVVAALLHDIGELMVPNAHGEVVASILRPYVTPRTTWLLAHHEVFQFYHYGHAWGADPVEKDLPRQMFASHPHFNATVNFCEVDQAAFDPDYPSLPSEFFVPMVERVLRRTPYWWARVTAHADEVDDTVRAKMALQAAYPGSALLPLHQPRPTAEPWSAAKGFVPRRFALSAIGGAGGEPAQLRALFEAYFEHGIVIVEGLASHDEAAWAQDVRGVVRALLPRGAADISDEPFWNSGTALRATYNDYVTNDVHRRAAAESDSNVSHAGWAGNVPMLLHHDGCFLAEAVRTKVYAAWGPSTMSNFMDGAAELAALDDDARQRCASIGEASLLLSVSRVGAGPTCTLYAVYAVLVEAP
ncbi:hypothetical protein EMIHUDRAFT_217176 [Emiliania huxleyi CCMP1516]|uniref:HD domain-containing protein n=2 Tax=Emiliania huxleyi TaxID=2903 RepID=A0A0D3IC83_EMIH1|nr:hypothetical protein EMIHUDRAFT_217176 [Emiliania huxleyi CCMP1516]EOD08868.1 hypothetical protein EMIHUDRAFT_217176 [Emiliania huxleyi CCMP1516]|eukprot:XP_005761297.1 hypothetical protein EMIHUDRAFT_217176 [Emiliania huxleyi CCMP1516]